MHLVAEADWTPAPFDEVALSLGPDRAITRAVSPLDLAQDIMAFLELKPWPEHPIACKIDRLCSPDAPRQERV